MDKFKLIIQTLKILKKHISCQDYCINMWKKYLSAKCIFFYVLCIQKCYKLESLKDLNKVSVFKLWKPFSRNKKNTKFADIARRRSWSSKTHGAVESGGCVVTITDCFLFGSTRFESQPTHQLF